MHWFSTEISFSCLISFQLPIKFMILFSVFVFFFYFVLLSISSSLCYGSGWFPIEKPKRVKTMIEKYIDDVASAD